MERITYTITCAPDETFLSTVSAESIDIVIIDPPYNTGNKKDKTVKYDRNTDFAKKNWINFHSDWDSIPNYYEWVYSWLDNTRRILKPTGSLFICGSFHSIPDTAIALRELGYYTIQWIQWVIPNSFPNLQMDKMVNANQTIIWARPYEHTKQYYDKEAAKRYNNGKNLRDYWEIPKESQRKSEDTPWLNHPSKKPTALIERAIDIALPKVDGGVVLDYFAGSGSMGEAVLNIARRYDIDITAILADREQEYIDNIRKRFTCYS
jgi:DNA modification methylase